tara:strand:+ start:86 stop:745 length:660 start_codon:yes stop_codon:yes gene_type:complete
MKNIIRILFCSAILIWTTNVKSEVTFGVSAGLTQISADGSETEGGEKTNKSVDSVAVIPSLFAEYAFTDSISLGLDIIPMSADVSDQTHSRTDVERSVTGTTTETSTSRTQKADAELKNHITVYGTYMLSDTVYLKGGIASVTLETNESLGTGSKYGNEDIYGTVIGFGGQNGNIRFEITYTDYEDISLTSSVARTGVTTNNKIEADLDALALRVSYLF